MSKTIGRLSGRFAVWLIPGFRIFLALLAAWRLIQISYERVVI